MNNKNFCCERLEGAYSVQNGFGLNFRIVKFGNVPNMLVIN